MFYQTGATALYIASQNGHANVVDLLLKAGAGKDTNSKVSNVK